MIKKIWKSSLLQLGNLGFCNLQSQKVKLNTVWIIKLKNVAFPFYYIILKTLFSFIATKIL